METCHVITNKGRCNNKISKFPHGDLSWTKRTFKGREFKSGEEKQLCQKDGIWKGVCSIHFNMYSANQNRHLNLA